MQNGNGKTQKYVFDIDGTICTQEQDDYTKAYPIKKMINKINQLYDEGNEIILNTARGYETGIDWSDVTMKQLQLWGVKYHDVFFGKPSADLYVDDKGCHVNDFIDEDSVEGLTTVEKNWGKEYLLDISPTYAMKRLSINAGKNISLQYHKKKRETWHIVKGIGIAKINGEEFNVEPGATIILPPETVHQVKAITDLVIIESSTIELDDIVRIRRDF